MRERRRPVSTTPHDSPLWTSRAQAGANLAASRTGDARAGDALDIWTYSHLRCVVRRLVDSDRNATDADEEAVFTIALRRVEMGRHSVQDPAAYAGWVSVVGKNAYLNYRRSRPPLRSVHEADLSYDAEEDLAASIDRSRMQRSIREAIERLPGFLRVVATMRFVEDQSYDAISKQIGKAKPTVRSYANKALDRFRSDELLRRLLRERV